MAKEYIEREAAKRIVDDIDTWSSGWRDYAKLQMDSLPAADVVPVRHGWWNDNVVAFYRKCSECGCCVEWGKKPFLFGDGEYNYCPNCGALMDKDGDGDV